MLYDNWQSALDAISFNKPLLTSIDIRKLKLSKEALGALITQLEYNPFIVKFLYGEVHLYPSMKQTIELILTRNRLLRAILNKNSNHTECDFRLYPFNNPCAKALAIALKNNYLVHQVFFHTIDIKRKYRDYISRLTRRNQLIQDIESNTSESLLAMDCRLNSTDMEIIGSVLSANHSLKSFNLMNNKLSDAGVGILCTVLANNNSIKSLDLRNNRITDKGAESLHAMLQNNFTLQSLSLFQNNISISLLRKIDVLTLRNIKLNVLLASRPADLAKLPAISFKDLPLSDEGLMRLIKHVLPHCINLKALFLMNCNLTNASAEQLIHFLTHDEPFRENICGIDLAGNTIDAEYMDTIKQLIEFDPEEEQDEEEKNEISKPDSHKVLVEMLDYCYRRLDNPDRVVNNPNFATFNMQWETIPGDNDKEKCQSLLNGIKTQLRLQFPSRLPKLKYALSSAPENPRIISFLDYILDDIGLREPLKKIPLDLCNYYLRTAYENNAKKHVACAVNYLRNYYLNMNHFSLGQDKELACQNLILAYVRENIAIESIDVDFYLALELENEKTMYALSKLYPSDYFRVFKQAINSLDEFTDKQVNFLLKCTEMDPILNTLLKKKQSTINESAKACPCR